MILKNVELSWAFINRVDDNGNYRVTFKVTDEQKAEIIAELDRVAKENGVDLKKCDWQGSMKELEEGGTIFTAKAKRTITTRNGETREVDLPVYNIKAQRFSEVPNISNGAIGNVVVEPYFAAFKKKQGVMLGLRSLQLLKYEVFVGAGDNPFTDESGEAPQEFKTFGANEPGLFD